MSIWQHGKCKRNYAANKIIHDTKNLPRRIVPKLNNENVEYHLHGRDNICVEDDNVHILIEKLVNIAYPTHEDEHDKRWETFYVPIKRNRRTIAVPIWIMEYNDEFFIIVQSFGGFSVKRGNGYTEKFYHSIISEALRFSDVIKKDGNILQKLVPYDIRTGRIKGCHILKELLSQQEKKDILENYRNYRTRSENGLQTVDICLNDYLNIVSLCYKAAYPEETEKLSNIDMYKRWADGRHGEMLSIKDFDSKDEFSEWYHGGKHVGSHPFEIVFSWHRHGIHMYPPEDPKRGYVLRVTNYAYAWDFIKMVNMLIKMQVQFDAGDLEAVLDYLAGDTYFTVNSYGEYNFKYVPSREYKRKYFYDIEWDDIKTLKYRNDNNSK